MKTAEQTWREAHNEWEKALSEDFEQVISRHIRQYATEVVKEHLIRAAVEARTKRTPDELFSVLVIDRDSITNIEIKLP